LEIFLSESRPASPPKRQWVSGIINIDRESCLSGKTHDKGVLILGGYFGANMLRITLDHEREISLTVIRRIDGDSDSSPKFTRPVNRLNLRPSEIAVTGSVNQKGEIKPIEELNRKLRLF
jgi:predicted ATP-dependent protease